MMSPNNDAVMLDEALAQYDILVDASYLHKLCEATLCPSTPQASYIKLLRINLFPSSPLYTQLSFTFNALASMDTIIGYILDSSPYGVFLYIGVKANSDPAFLLLKNGLINTFPNIELKLLSCGETNILLDHWFSPNSHTSISATTVIPNNNDPLPSQLINLMGNHETYLAFFLATPFCKARLCAYLEELIQLYNVFSLYIRTNYNELTGVSNNDSTSFSHTSTHTESNSNTINDTTNTSCSNAKYNNITPSTSLPLTDSRSLGINVLFNHASSYSSGSSSSKANCLTESNAKATGKTSSYAVNKISNHSIGYTAENKLLIDAQLNLIALIARLKSILNNGCFELGAYFLSSSPETSLRAAFTYQGLALNYTNPLGPTAVNSWCANSNKLIPILKELRQFSQPLFVKDAPHESYFSLTSIVNSSEFVNTIYFPSSINRDL